MAKVIELPPQPDNPLALTHIFICPGCRHPAHGFRVTGPEPRWSWNGDPNHPTVEGSVLTISGNEHGPTRCHLFIRDGKIQYLSDCTHALAGQTVNMEDI